MKNDDMNIQTECYTEYVYEIDVRSKTEKITQIKILNTLC